VHEGADRLLFDCLPGQSQHLQDGVEVPAATGRLFVDNQADFKGELSNEFVVCGIQKSVQQILDNQIHVLWAGDDIQQIQRHRSNQNIVLIQAVIYGGPVIQNGIDIVLRQQVQDVKRQVFTVGVLDGDKPTDHLHNHIPQLWGSLQNNHGLEAFEQN
jgi:hypothetical protein